MDARALTFPDASFDVILFVGTLHHMDDGLIEQCFLQIKRVLRPDGVVLCAEPVFTEGKPLSRFLLLRDRGEFIRDEPGYRRLFGGFGILRQDFSRSRCTGFARSCCPNSRPRSACHKATAWLASWAKRPRG